MGISYGGISQLFTAATQPAQPRGDLAAVGPRRHRDDALPGRHPQHRLRGRVGPGAQARGQGRVGHRRAAVGVRADPGGRHDLRGQPGAAPRGRRPDGEDRRQRPLRARGRRPARPGHLRQQDQGADVHGLPVAGRADRRPLPDAGRKFTGTNQKWFTFTNGAHIDSLDPETFNRWYDFLQLYVAKRGADHELGADPRPPRRSSTRRRWASRGVTLPPDPIQLHPTYDAALAAFEQLPSIRVLFDNGAGGAQPGPPGSRPSSARGRASRSRAPPRARGTSARAARSADAPAGAGRGQLVHLERARPAADELHRRHRGGPGGSGRDAALSVEQQNPPGSAVSYVTAPLSANTTVVGGGAVHALGQVVDARRRPAGDDQRGPARRQGDLRAERLGARQRAQARRRQEHAARAGPDLRAADVSPMPADSSSRWRSRSTTRATRTAPGRASGVTIAAPNGDQPIWSFGETEPDRHRQRLDRALAARCRRGSSCRSCPA